MVRYDDLVRPMVGAHPEGFCKLIVESRRRYILGAHVLGEYSAEVIQMAAACMAANMRVEQVAELQPAFPTFTEAVGMSALKIVRRLGIAPWAPSWSDLRPAMLTPEGSASTAHARVARDPRRWGAEGDATPHGAGVLKNDRHRHRPRRRLRPALNETTWSCRQ